MDVLIVGGGIGGLALAACLDEHGIKATIVDKAHEWKAAGYGIALWPNGLRVLETLGADGPIREKGVRISEQVLYDSTGRVLGRFDLDEIARRYGPIHVVNRSFLHEVLQKRNRSAKVRLNTTVRSLRDDGGKVSVAFSDGTAGEFDLVVGADGIHSGTRGALFPQVKPRYLGMTSWVIWMPKVGQSDASIKVVVGNGKVFGIYPTNGDQHACGYFAMSAPPEADDPAPERIRNLRAHYDDLSHVLPGVLDCLPENPNDIFHHDHDQIDARRWHKGRVALLGDAAHALSPLLGMGASMAMEDAFVLAHELRAGDVPAALKAYERKRKARLGKLQRLSNTADYLLKLELPSPIARMKERTLGWMLNGFYLGRIERVLGESPVEKDELPPLPAA